MERITDSEDSKHSLWSRFVCANRLNEDSVPLFAASDGMVTSRPYGRDSRPVLVRSTEMDELLRRLGQTLVDQYRAGAVIHDGLLYLMFRREPSGIVPLYFGKAEVYGKGDANLSANISDLTSGDGKFGRWGYNYAYHMGDLSAATLDGHPASKRTRKYEAWGHALFELTEAGFRLKGDIRFWACLWGPDRSSIWSDYGSTRLAFEEYLLIGVASDLFPNDLLNREGRNNR